MKKNLYCESSIDIVATPAAIWHVLTAPDKVRIYMFGSEVATNWNPGNTVTFSRKWDGLLFVDKGEILEYEPEKVLKFSYWSSQEGYEDIPENYSVITYTIEKKNEITCEFTYRRDKIPLEKERTNQEKYLPVLMVGIKKLAEDGHE
jgi:uncharacterized protein YndB with AHSA1/START domain